MSNTGSVGDKWIMMNETMETPKSTGISCRAGRKNTVTDILNISGQRRLWDRVGAPLFAGANP
jgi:hypothetical protein